jgi:beta-lactamase class A
MDFMKRTIITFLISFLTLSILLNIGLSIVFLQKGTSEKQHENQELIRKYPLLSKRILSDFDKDLIINFVSLRAKLRNLVEKEYGSDFSFYFEYLPTGSSIGVNEKVEFYSASLLKLPFVMAYLYSKEKNNYTGDEIITIEERDIDNHFGVLWKAGAGKKIGLNDIVELALIESDNTAGKILERQTTAGSRRRIFSGLDIEIIVDENNKASITTKNYSSILRALFFSSILSKDNSQYILDLLTKTSFNDKLPAGVPKNIPVAHKIGVYENLAVPVYSDCGIVYVPKREYLLCMASRSDDKTASERMKTVSQIIYNYVSTVNTN